MLKKCLMLLFIASVSLTEIIAAENQGKVAQEMEEVLNLNFGFSNTCTNTTFQISSSNITGDVISFSNDGQTSYAIPANGTPIGGSVGMQLRYKPSQLFKNPQAFQMANADPDTITFTNGLQGDQLKKFTIQIFPIIENETGLGQETKIGFADVVNVGIQELAIDDQDCLIDFEIQDIQ